MTRHIVEWLPVSVQDVCISAVKQLFDGVFVVDDDHVLLHLHLVRQVVLLRDDSQLLRDVTVGFLRIWGQFVVYLHLLLDISDEVVDSCASL